MCIHLAFLGTGTCNASDRSPSAAAISLGGEVVCIDFGGGAYHRMARLADRRFNYRSISVIMLTHFHVDHVSGLPDLLWGEMWDSRGKREKPLTLVGPGGLENFYRQRLLPFVGGYPLPFEVNLVELAPGEHFKGSGFSAVSRRLDHGEYSTGYLFETGEIRLAVTGDTGYCGALEDLMSAATHGIMEWSIQDHTTFPGHLSAADVAALVEKNLLPPVCFITHMYLPAGVGFEEQVALNRKITGESEVKFVFPRDGDIFALDR